MTRRENEIPPNYCSLPLLSPMQSKQQVVIWLEELSILKIVSIWAVNFVIVVLLSLNFDKKPYFVFIIQQ